MYELSTLLYYLMIVFHKFFGISNDCWSLYNFLKIRLVIFSKCLRINIIYLFSLKLGYLYLSNFLSMCIGTGFMYSRPTLLQSFSKSVSVVMIPLALVFSASTIYVASYTSCFRFFDRSKAFKYVFFI